MEQQTNSQRRRSGHRRGGIFPILAWCLLAVTLFGLFSGYSPEKTLQRALEATATALAEKEEDALFLLSALQEGSLSFSGEGIQGDYDARLPQGLSLSVEEGDHSFSYFAAEDSITLSGSLFPKGARSTGRDGAVFSLSGSALDRESVKAEHLSFARLLLAQSDPALSDVDGLSKALARIWRKAKPTLTKMKGALEEGEKPLEVTHFSHRLSSDGLVRGLNALLKEGQKEEIQKAALAQYALFLSACGKEVTPTDSEQFLAFLQGKGESFEAFSNLMGKADSFLEFRLSLYEGAVVALRVDFSFGEYQGSADLFLGADPASSSEEHLRLSLSRGEEPQLNFALTHRITDDSKAAFIRELSWSLSDHTGFFCPEDAPENGGTLRYSWGREKGDLGLKWISGEEQVNFRATLIDYKKGKRLVVNLTRIEENGENLLPCDQLEICLDRKSEFKEVPESIGELFPEGEEKESLGADFDKAYFSFFGEEAA